MINRENVREQQPALNLENLEVGDGSRYMRLTSSDQVTDEESGSISDWGQNLLMLKKTMRIISLENIYGLNVLLK